MADPISLVSEQFGQKLQSDRGPKLGFSGRDKNGFSGHLPPVKEKPAAAQQASGFSPRDRSYQVKLSVNSIYLEADKLSY